MYKRQLRPLSGEILRHSFERIHTDPHGASPGKEAEDLIELLVEDIFLGGVRTEDLCAEIIKVIYQSVDFHHQKGAVATKKAKVRLYEELIRRKPWLRKFLYPKDFEYYWGDGVKNPIEVLAQWNHDFSHVAGIVTKYQVVDKKLVYSIGRYVVTHVDEAPTLDSVAHDLYLNKCYASHIFKRETGLSFVAFLTEVKMDRAAVLLRDPQRKISEIAAILGYNDGEYFSRCFKRLRGETPSDYRKRMKIHWQKPSLSMAYYEA